MHLLEYRLRMFDYLRAFESQAVAMPLFRPQLHAYSLPTDPEGYADASITDDLISDVYLEFNQRTRERESMDYIRTLSGKAKFLVSIKDGQLKLFTLNQGVSLSMDHTFKAANKAIVVTPDNKHVRVMKGGLLTIINEQSEIIAWVSLIYTPYNYTLTVGSHRKATLSNTIA